MTTPIGLRPMHSRPNPGQRVTVLMRDGTQLNDCCSTMIYVADRAGIVIYHKRQAVDESLAKGWWPVTPNAKSEPTRAALSREVGSTDGFGGTRETR